MLSTVSSKFAIDTSLKILPLFKRVATLPCDILNFSFQTLHRPLTESTAMVDQTCTHYMTVVDELVLSQEDQPQIHSSTRQISQSTVIRIMF